MNETQILKSQEEEVFFKRVWDIHQATINMMYELRAQRATTTQ